MAIISVKSLLDAGVHFGHRISRWNPKMAPYIFGKRNLIHIINLKETVKGLIRGYHFLRKVSAQGGEVIFVGTKRQSKTVLRRLAQQCNMPYVAERWLGGTLTNFDTIRKRLARLEELDRMEQEGTLEGMGKKYASALRREKKKIDRNLEGIKSMVRMPSALIIVDPKKEHNALKEAAKLGIPTICLIDTDSDPDLVDIIIPGNDEAMRSIEVICSKLAEAVAEGRAEWQERQKIEAKIHEETRPASTDAAGTSPKPFAKQGEDPDKSHKGKKFRYKKDGRGKESKFSGRRKDRRQPEGPGRKEGEGDSEEQATATPPAAQSTEPQQQAERHPESQALPIAPTPSEGQAEPQATDDKRSSQDGKKPLEARKPYRSKKKYVKKTKTDSPQENAEPAESRDSGAETQGGDSEA